MIKKQLTIFDIEQDSCSIADIDSELKTAKFRAIQRYLNRGKRETIAVVNKYKAGNRHNYHYFRLSYRVGSKMRHIHINGGNTLAELAQYRARKIQQMIDRGAALEEVIAATKDFNSGGK